MLYTSTTTMAAIQGFIIVISAHQQRSRGTLPL